MSCVGASKANPMGARARGAKELRSPSLYTQACAYGALCTTHYLPLIHENAYNKIPSPAFLHTIIVDFSFHKYTCGYKLKLYFRFKKNNILFRMNSI